MEPELCVCGHKKISHRYLALIGENSGECLALVFFKTKKCACEMYEEKE